MRRWVLVLLLAVGCAGPDSFPLPDRSDPVVREEEARIAKVVAADRSGRLLTAPGTCEVRLLRRVDDVYYAWADCTAGITSMSLPVRVEGSLVRVPGDGSLYGDSVRELFPDDIAGALLEHPERYRP